MNQSIKEELLLADEGPSWLDDASFDSKDSQEEEQQDGGQAEMEGTDKENDSLFVLQNNGDLSGDSMDKSAYWDLKQLAQKSRVTNVPALASTENTLPNPMDTPMTPHALLKSLSYRLSAAPDCTLPSFSLPSVVAKKAPENPDITTVTLRSSPKESSEELYLRMSRFLHTAQEFVRHRNHTKHGNSNSNGHENNLDNPENILESNEKEVAASQERCQHLQLQLEAVQKERREVAQRKANLQSQLVQLQQERALRKQQELERSLLETAVLEPKEKGAIAGAWFSMIGMDAVPVWVLVYAVAGLLLGHLLMEFGNAGRNVVEASQ